MIYFGTDGIRGIVGSEITQDICQKCGNAIASIKHGANIIVGTDTRTSASLLLTSFASGAVLGGANVCYVGIVPTPAISFLVQKYGADFGVMLTASHNSAEYNGIKVFASDGKKIDTITENQIERNFAKQKISSYENLGKFAQRFDYINSYIQNLIDIGQNLKGLKVVVDASNGSNYKIAKIVFKKLGADCHFINCKNDGKNINNGCGALHPQKLAGLVKKLGADVGFAFDGDADRIVLVDEKGQICDGDQIILYLTKMYRQFDIFKSGAVVTTVQSNMAIEKELSKESIKLIRTDVGDRNVTEMLLQKDLQIGGEQAGHIILTDFGKTGDGLLTAVVISKFLLQSKRKLSDDLFYDLYVQQQKNIEVKDKYKIINSAKLKIFVSELERDLDGRILVRASGTEPKIRIMVECQNKVTAQQILDKLVAFVEENQ